MRDNQLLPVCWQGRSYFRQGRISLGKFSKLIAVATAMLLGFGVPIAVAQSKLPPTKLVSVENGWYGEWLVITALSGTGGCASSLPTEFAVETSHPAYDAILAIALTALTTGSDVSITAQVGTCVLGSRTKVLSIQIVK